MSELNRVRAFLLDQPWAMLPSAFEAMCQVLERRIEGREMTAEQRAEFEAGRKLPKQNPKAEGIAVLPLQGAIAPKMNLMTDISGGTSTQAFGAAFQAAVDDSNVSAIVFDVDSPGGSVYGLEELAAQIQDAKGRKPIVAQVYPMAGSAAYWITSQADEIVVSPSGEVGSIGIIARHMDMSKAAENEGVKVTYMTTSKYKGETNEFEPLSDEAKDYHMSVMREYHEKFVAAVAQGRRVSSARVEDHFGQGRMVTASQAISRGMADRTGTMTDTIQRLQDRASRARKTAALRAMA